MESWWVTLEYSKEGDLRFLSHLDVVRALERALRRSGLPLAWKGKYNPRPRLSMGPALPLGVASEWEVFAVALERPLPPGEVQSRLGPQMPRGLALRRVLPGKQLPGPGEETLWRILLPGPLPSPEELGRARANLGEVLDRRGRVLDAPRALVDLEVEEEALRVRLAPVGGRSLAPGLLARSLGLGRPKMIVKLAPAGSRPEGNTKEFHVEKNFDQRSGSGRTPDRGGGERPSPGDSYRQPQP